ncbi:hypothetical protein [Halorubrum lacusprofundi]|uniref:Uncharacterized protein n=1 Tax=Halorubrum lacusprofundi (strain ATCC 49239 / DSM 5036 / JCM 8891 / ACAM 34) TaxID=416348 RepID=B9LNV0_HALLT|nr:hypothetical protein [Halorubrum lacusprofundi]ACM57038.1 hypothetical protein Hlac_1450 [Halorubrum lacusprofundi ATCC 49239]
MIKSRLGRRTLQKLGIVSTLLDAVSAFARRDVRTGLLLLGAAIVSIWVPGLGVVASVLTRLYRKFRRGRRLALGGTELIEQGVFRSEMEAKR